MSVRYSVLELSIEMFCANLESTVWKRHVGAQLLALQYGGRKSSKTSDIHFSYKKRSDHDHHHEQVNIQIHTSRKISTVEIVKNHKMKHFLSVRDSLQAAIFDLGWRETPNSKCSILKTANANFQ